MDIQIITQNLETQAQEQQTFSLPVVIGREITELPNKIEEQDATPLVLIDSSNQISRFHALIKYDQTQVLLEDRSSNGTLLNEEKILKQSRPLKNGDILKIGIYTLTINIQLPTILNPEPTILVSPTQPPITSSSTIIFNPETDLLEFQTIIPSSPVTGSGGFPPAHIFQNELISVEALRETSIPIEEKIYVSLGGGMGSFVWVDMMRIAGVTSEQIAVIGLNPVPYARYERLLRNCQIPRHKRIRSGSDSCPDNIWGWPGYALRESWRDLLSGKIASSLGYLWQVFSEPVFADTYTPYGDNVFNSMVREKQRISWDQMFRQGSIRSIRKTQDGRYCIAYSASGPEHSDYRFLLTHYVHLCTGYPALKLLPDLQKYREETQDLKSVVQGYEPHDHVYEKLEKDGGTIILRGSGIVASQIMDRLYLARKVNPNIQIIHMNRDPRRGNRFGLAKREVENDWEFQPYNWPKGTWGGDMRQMLEKASPQVRMTLLRDWGGTTTASRKSWRGIIYQGLTEGWYQIKYGLVQKVEPRQGGGILTTLMTNQGEQNIDADFIVDCTGLISDPRENPLINDLIVHYHLDLNPQERLHVENDFEIIKMRNQYGKFYASGIITLGGPYAPVDTFLGLQYSAHRVTESLATHQAPNVKYIEGIYSIQQWLKWATNQRP
ncbi:FHA domain-containing protein [Gloeocapsa sp. PCC 73106]|uniref:FHA domain-containing protein n=1 Tax=Gloeocapsa sp. PCC 73106 TaxID=102232 RepID=UPI0002AC2449|nr:FHA domain-containing protein [Gloeocapsa sp. PCC 73106]ELR99598.1 FHA domain-containing protein [Gloeocapsa sp. PCC 73106]